VGSGFLCCDNNFQEARLSQLRVIKKYPNRRLYDTQTSTYITLAEVKALVLDRENFQVVDAKTQEDLTRSILLQIILEEEGHNGVPIFNTEVLGHIIRFYGNAMQGVMGGYLEKSIGAFLDMQAKLQEQAKSLYGEVPTLDPNAWAEMVKGKLPGLPNPPGIPNVMTSFMEQSASMFTDVQEQMRKQAMSFFGGFTPPGAKPEAPHDKEPPKPRPRKRST
jgi:polyhydroxyalkanoate synthesis repressor PhaR